MQSALYFPCLSNIGVLCLEEPLEQRLTKKELERDIYDTHRSIFGIYGLESFRWEKIRTELSSFNITTLEYKGNHHRACLDLMEYNKLSILEGNLKKIFLNENHFKEFFTHMGKLRDSPFWKEINEFLQEEVPEEWKKFKQAKNTIKLR